MRDCLLPEVPCGASPRRASFGRPGGGGTRPRPPLSADRPRRPCRCRCQGRPTRGAHLREFWEGGVAHKNTRWDTKDEQQAHRAWSHCSQTHTDHRRVWARRVRRSVVWGEGEGGHEPSLATTAARLAGRLDMKDTMSDRGGAVGVARTAQSNLPCPRTPSMPAQHPRTCTRLRTRTVTHARRAGHPHPHPHPPPHTTPTPASRHAHPQEHPAHAGKARRCGSVNTHARARVRKHSRTHTHEPKRTHAHQQWRTSFPRRSPFLPGHVRVV
jgi:hypothetical protein